MLEMETTRIKQNQDFSPSCFGEGKNYLLKAKCFFDILWPVDHITSTPTTRPRPLRNCNSDTELHALLSYSIPDASSPVSPQPPWPGLPDNIRHERSQMNQIRNQWGRTRNPEAKRQIRLIKSLLMMIKGLRPGINFLTSQEAKCMMNCETH